MRGVPHGFFVFFPTVPSERPHFVVVNYDTASFRLTTLAMFTSGTEAKCELCQPYRVENKRAVYSHGWRTVLGLLLSVLLSKAVVQVF